MRWFTVLRLPMLLVGALLAILSFEMSGVEILWLPIVSGVVIGSAAMAQNDWRDRFNDGKKGKTLALFESKRFLLLVVGLWLMSVLLTAIVWRLSIWAAVLLSGLIAIGLLYSEFRRVPMFPNMLVATASASLALFPVALQRNTPNAWPLFLATFLAIFGREILKDLEDLDTDGNHKWTLPLKFGEPKSRIMAAGIIAGAAVVCMTISPATIVGVLLLFLSSGSLLFEKRIKVAKTLLDSGMLVVILSLFFVI